MAVLLMSHSRADRLQVRALVALLTTGLRGIEKAVFCDGDVEAGDRWFGHFTTTLETCEHLFVLWCAHAAESVQVQGEYAYALGRSKRVVPILLDATPLPEPLTPMHGVDLRGFVKHDVPLANLDLDYFVFPDERERLELRQVMLARFEPVLAQWSQFLPGTSLTAPSSTGF